MEHTLVNVESLKRKISRKPLQTLLVIVFQKREKVKKKEDQMYLQGERCFFFRPTQNSRGTLNVFSHPMSGGKTEKIHYNSNDERVERGTITPHVILGNIDVTFDITSCQNQSPREEQAVSDDLLKLRCRQKALKAFTYFLTYITTLELEKLGTNLVSDIIMLN